MISSGYYDAQWRKYENGGTMSLCSLIRVCIALETTPSGAAGRYSIAGLLRSGIGRQENIKVTC